MAKVEIYSDPMCGFCARAKRLLNSRGIEFHEYNLWEQPEKREEMLKRAAGRRTVPQIFIDDQGIGGSDELHQLDARGELEKIVNPA